MRRAARVDANHRAICDALARIPGLVLVDLSGAGEGVPDLVAGWRGRWHFLEIKDGTKPPSARKLTPAQVQWHAAAHAAGLPCSVVLSLADALDALGIPDKRTP